MRLDPKLDEQIKKAARANRRSAHQQVVLWIEEGIEREKAKNGA